MGSLRLVSEPPGRKHHAFVWNIGLLVGISLGSLCLHLFVVNPYVSESSLLDQRVAVVQPMFHTERTPGTHGNTSQLPLGRVPNSQISPGRLSNSQLPPKSRSNRTHVPPKSLSHRTKVPKSLANSTQLLSHPLTSKKLITMSEFRGRLGNQMFEYASLKGLARLTNRTPVLTRWPSHLHKTFQNLQISMVKRRMTDWHRMGENRLNTTKAISDVVNSKYSSISTCCYYQCPLYFDTALEEVRNEFVFREKHTERANSLLKNMTPKGWGKGSFVRVAIHMRQGDLATWVDKGITFPPKPFFKNAIDFFRKKYKRVLFVIGSDKPEGCAGFFKQFKGTFVFLSGQPYYIDMATLSLCDHAIITIGTFSWWVGWLVKGTTVYYKGHVRENSLFGRIWKANEYIPKKDKFNNWVALM